MNFNWRKPARFTLGILIAGLVGVICHHLTNFSHSVYTDVQSDNLSPAYSSYKSAVAAANTSGWDRKASCKLAFGDRNGLQVHNTCDLHISNSDPLFRLVQAGEVDQTVLYREVIGLGDGFTSGGLPDVVYSHAESRVTIHLETKFIAPWPSRDSFFPGIRRAESFSNVVLSVFDHTAIREKGDVLPGLVRDRTLTVEFDKINLVGVESDIQPDERDAKSIVFSGAPGRLLEILVSPSNPTSLFGDQVGDSWLLTSYVPAVEIFPVFLVLLLGRKSRSRSHRRVQNFALCVLIGIFVLGAAIPLIGEPFVNGWILLCSSVGIVVSMLATRSVRQRILPEYGPLLVLALSIVGVTMWRATLIDPSGRLGLSVGIGTLIVAVLGRAVFVLLGGHQWSRAGLTLSLATAASCFVVDSIDWLPGLSVGGNVSTEPIVAAVIGTLCGLSFYPLLKVALGFSGVHVSTKRLALVTSGTLLISLASLLAVSSPDLVFHANLGQLWEYWPLYARIVLVLLLLPVLKAVSDARSAIGQPSIMACAAGLICAVIPWASGDRGGAPELLSMLVVTLLLFWLMPRSRACIADRLQLVSMKAHGRLVRSEVRRRILRQAATQSLRASQSSAASGGDWKELTARFDEIEQFEHRKIPDNDTHISAHLAAFGSGGGRRRWENLRQGALYGLVLSLPLIIFETWTSFGGIVPNLVTSSTLEAFDHLRWVLRWTIYGALFGYFYTSIRGRVPVVKATCMLGVVGLGEVIVVLGNSADVSAPVLFIFVRIGFLIYFFFALGLIWERNLANSASVPWGRVRDFRRFRSLVAPATTVLVAGLTVVATTFANVAVSPITPENPTNSRPTDIPGLGPVPSEPSGGE